MVNDKAMGYTQLQSRSDEELCACAASGSRAAEEILAPPVLPPCAQHARGRISSLGATARICCRRGCWVCSRRSGSMTPGATRPSAPLPSTCIRNRLCTALRAASAGQAFAAQPIRSPCILHSLTPIPLSHRLIPRFLLIDREKTANLLDSAQQAVIRVRGQRF